MTINLSDNDPRVSYDVAAGVTQTSFTVSFEFFDNDDLNVYVDGTLKTLTTDYTVSGGDGSTGTVTMSVTGASGGSKVVITRDIDLDRTTDFPSSGPFNIASLNTELDRFVAIAADLKDQADRALQLTDFDAAASLTLPAVDDRKGTVLAFNSTTGAVEAGPTTSNVNSLADVTDDIATLADIEDGTDATDAIQTVAGISSNVTTVAGISSNVTTVASISANVTTVAGDEVDIGTVAGSISNVNTVATNIADVNTAATNITDIQNASTNAATATTKASEAATSATNAATSATNAATSETNAATSATAAAASQTAAANSAAAAAAAFDNFDDTYLGSKTSDPTVDNDGDSLTSGDLYFNSTANEMRVYDGANWIAATSAGNVSLLLYEYTATSGQTTFSGSDDNSATLSYTVNNIQVVMNGVILDPSDYTATSGTSVVLGSGASTGDLVNIYAFKSFTTADMVPASTGGTFSGDVEFSADVGIGTSSPMVALNVHDSTNARIALTNSSTGQTFPDGFELLATGLDAYLQNRSNGNMIFTTNNSERMRIDSSGNVGIGISSVPSAARAMVSGGRFYVNSQDQYSVLLQNSGTSGGFIGTTASNTINFFNSSGTERMRIDSNGNLLVGKTVTTDYESGCRFLAGANGSAIISSDNDTLVVWADNGTANTGGAKGHILFKRGTNNALVGSITSTTTSTVYNTSSDHRLKENVVELTGATTRLKQLEPKRFNFIADADTTVDGFIAHEVQTVVPEAITGTHNEVDADGNPVYQGIDQSKLVPLLTAALQEAIAKIETLETKVAALENNT